MSLKRYLTRSLIKFLPLKGRRTILLTTLFMKLNDIKPGNLVAMQEFNNNIHIVDDIKALKLPCHLYKLIWDEMELPIETPCESTKRISDNEILLLSHRILEESDLVKRNDDKKSLVDDIRKIIDFTIKKKCGFYKTAIC